MMRRVLGYFMFIFIMTASLWGYYFLVFKVFDKEGFRVAKEKKTLRPQDPSLLEKRLGTVLWHSSSNSAFSQTYCYYPSGSILYEGKRGENIIKKVGKYADCIGWFGITEAREGSWLSENVKKLSIKYPQG